MTAQGAATGAEREMRRATDNRWFRGVARAGYVASGIIQGLVGGISIEVALQHSSSSPDQSGALADVAKAPGGPLLLWVVAIGAFALGLWLIVSGIATPGADPKHRWGHRLSDWGKAVVYLVIGIAGLRFALGGSTSSSSASSKGSSDVLSLPGGQVLLVLVGLGVLAIGVGMIVSGVTKRFLKTIRVPPGTFGRVTVALGVIGYVARGIAIGAVGVLFVVAAFTLDSKKATGLDGALKAFAALPFGAVLLVLIGLGWIAAGVYTVIRARVAVLD